MKTPTPEYDNTAAELVCNAPQIDPDFKAKLEARLLNKLQRTRSHRPLIRKMLYAAAAAVLLLTVFLFTPSGKAMLDYIVQLGYIQFTSDATPAENEILSPENTAVTARTQSFSSPENAAAAAGFPVFYPNYLPDGYPENPAMGFEVVFDSNGNPRNVSLMYIHTQSGEILAFSQIPLQNETDIEPLPIGIGSAEAESVTILDNAGVFLKDANWGTREAENGASVPVPYNLLIWETENFQFWCFSEARLEVAELIRIAESFSP